MKIVYCFEATLKFLPCLPPKDPVGHFSNIEDKVVLQNPTNR